MALIRVKRRLQDDPIDVLLFSCKKPKTEDNSETKVFKFATTVNEQDADLRQHINEVKNVKRLPLKYREISVSSITEKLRLENKLTSQNNRLKVVNFFRSTREEKESLGENENYTVVDLENTQVLETPTTAQVSNSESSSAPLTEEQFVYDLYYSALGDIDDLQMENLLSIHAVKEELIFGDYLDNGESDSADDDDDSNDENNWRNDYPDERSNDEFSSDDENVMRLAMQVKNIAVDDDDYRSDLSSDDQDSLLIYEDRDPDYYSQTESSRSESSISYYSSN